MNEYIKREAVIEIFDNHKMDFSPIVRPIFKVCNYLVSQLPAADVVEVVRCKDCKYSFEDDFDSSWWCCREDDREVVETHFCSYGERRAE